MNKMTASATAVWDEEKQAWRVHVEWDNGNHLESEYWIAAGDEGVIPIAINHLVGIDPQLYEDEWIEEIT